MLQEEKKCDKGAPKWMVTFSDMMSLLVTFFVLLLSFANMDMQKYKDVLGSMEKAFGSQKKIYQLGKDGGMSNPIPMESSIKENAEEKESMVNLLMNRMKEEGLDKNLFIIKDKNGIRIELAGNVVFEPGKIVLNEKAKKILNRLVPFFQETLYKIQVEGHTDNSQINNKLFKDNWELSAIRATVVVKYFIKQGLKSKRLSAVGCADTKPLFANDTKENKEKNRRVTIRYLMD